MKKIKSGPLRRVYILGTIIDIVERTWTRTSFEEEDDVRRIDIVHSVPAQQGTEIVPDTKLLVFAEVKQSKHKFTELHLWIVQKCLTNVLNEKNYKPK